MGSLGDLLGTCEAALGGLLGGFLSSTSMSTRTVLDKAGSSLVNVPCLTNREEFWLLVLLVPLVALCALAQLIVLGAGEAKGARILDF